MTIEERTEELQKEIQKQHREKISKYTYYQIALAVAAIGFSINLAINLKLNYTQIPLGLAVICWAISIIFGFRFIELELDLLHNNNSYFDIILGKHSLSGQHPEKIKIGSDTLMEIMKDKSEKTAPLGNKQRWWLYFGMVSFIIWCIIKMYLNK